MKTIEQYINLFKSPYREQALANIFSGKRNKEVNSCYNALYHAFSWTASKEGSDYWNNYYNELRLNFPNEPGKAEYYY